MFDYCQDFTPDGLFLDATLPIYLGLGLALGVTGL